jgi:hypothetical protein
LPRSLLTFHQTKIGDSPIRDRIDKFRPTPSVFGAAGITPAYTGKREKFTAREPRATRSRILGRLGIRDLPGFEIERVIGEVGGGGMDSHRRLALFTHALPIGLHWQQSPAVFSLVDFGFSPFQLLIFDQQQRVGVEIHSLRQAQHRAGVEMPLAQRAPCCADLGRVLINPAL